MKKLSLIFIALSLTILFLGCGNTNEAHRYSTTDDKDTIESFGIDGQFGIYKLFHNNKNSLDLFDAKNDKRIDVITDYEEINPYVYTIGEKGYTKLNYTTGEFSQSDSLAEFSDTDKKIFNNLK